ncbi:uncharacterized protein EV422DRAFT_566795 [Fimicolochytrium jonesii]|uniref:uncharacterized protein n=1 Tax=Fimicolochytrium jonesii TaxID=1396493 RepID=UPI0022FEF0A1|nr:uncharacterized protein EV422DRAFT_566795 [Fimicolochytrium jonesii]KAI8821718.1 hypothetical protein EV422DRAFT_566795 [Fimicolochytrium jonesii]
MRARDVLLNILWFLLGGEVLFLLYCIGGLLMMITIVGIPFGIEAIKLGSLSLLPFGAAVGNLPGIHGLRFVFNVVWFLVIGWIIALFHFLLSLIFAVTIIGLPFAYEHWKLGFVGAFPFGKIIVH